MKSEPFGTALMFSRKLFVLITTVIFLSGCIKPAPEKEPWELQSKYNFEPISATETVTPLTKTVYVPPTRDPNKPIYTPTPDFPKVLPTVRSSEEVYYVQPFDSLNLIAKRYAVDLNVLVKENEIVDPNYLDVGQLLRIPPPNPDSKALDFKIIPDSELIYSPSNLDFNPHDLIYSFESYLSSLEHSDEVIMQVAKEYSINPKLILSVLEYSTGWMTGPKKVIDQENEPIEVEKDAWKTDLYTYLSRMANALNFGYYSWKSNNLGYYFLIDGSYIFADETVNAGTVAVHTWAATVFGKDNWYKAISEEGVYKTYHYYFGYPFDYVYEPLIPEDFTQPELVLPFQKGVPWSFTGGPHSGWGDGSAWAALDFAPPGSPMGCNVSLDWVTAIADGIIVRSDHGAVVQDLDGDGYEQTGWSILYLHLAEWERVKVGTQVSTGDLIGHASCEGGFSNGTHLHIARRYNGEWIPADGSVPFVMSGFEPQSDGIAYNGFLVGNGEYIEAWAYFRPESLVQH